MGKTIVIAAGALLLGILVGGLGPRRELAETRKALAAAEAKSRASGAAAALPLALGLGSLAASSKEGPAGETPARRVPRFVEEPAPAGDNGPGGERPRRRSPLEDADAFAMAKTAAELRATQYKNAFLEEARMPAAGAAALDSTIKTMNEELERAASDSLATLEARRQKGEKLVPRDFADAGARFLEIYRRTDDTWKAGLDGNTRAALGRSDFDLVTQVDIGVFRRLAESFGRGDFGRGDSGR